MPETAVAQGTPYRLRCLGPVSFTAPDGLPRRFRTRKQMGLLLLLARRGRPQGKDQLVELLWGADDTSAARHSLAQSISLINKVFGQDAIYVAGKDQVKLRDGLVWLDADEFERAAVEGRHAEARALWRGKLLDGLWVQRAPGFEAWVEAERERLTSLYRQVLHAAIEAERKAGDWNAMRETAEALLALDQLDESAMLAYLEALALGGDRTLALRRYGEFEKRLKDELDADPGAALKAWIKRHRKGDETPVPATPLPRVAETQVLPTARPVYGREEEFKFLWDAWTSAQQRQGSFIILEGPAGIGKSALAGKLANQAHVMGGAVCFVRCWKTEKSVPFAPITALIRQLMRLPGFVALNELWIGELSRLVPELRERYPNAPAPMAIDESARHRICDGTMQGAACVADEQPLMIVVDDVHDADEATLALIHYVGRQAKDQPVLLLCASRQGQAATELERAFFETSRAIGIAGSLQLEPLGSEHTSKLVRQIIAERGLDVDDNALDEMLRTASGNPLQAIELATALSSGVSSQRRARKENALQRIEPVDSFQNSAIDRLTTLSYRARHVAALLAAAGRSLTDYELASVSGLPTADLAYAVGELETANFVRRTGNAWAFAHERYQAATQKLQSSDQAATHKRLAEFLSRSASDNPAARYEVALHYELAGKREEAAREAKYAAHYAKSIGAMRERALALALADRVNGLDWTNKAELAHCSLLLQDYEAVDRLLAHARLGSLQPAHRAEFEFVEISTAAKRGAASWAETSAKLQDLLERSSDFVSRKQAQLLAMRAADRSGLPLVARLLARRFRKTAAGKRHTPSAYELAATGFIRIKYYWPESASRWFVDALQAAQQSGEIELEKWCRQGLGALHLKTGQFEACVSQYDECIALARRLLDFDFEAGCFSDKAVAELALGRLADAERSLNTADELSRGNPRWLFNAYVAVNRAALAFHRRDYDKAASLFEQASSIAQSSHVWSVMINASSGRALCALRTGKKDEFSAWTQRARQHLGDKLEDTFDRAFLEVAMAWSDYLSGVPAAKVATALRKRALRSRRRDIEDSFIMELEAVRISEHATGVRDAAARTSLRAAALPYKLSLIVAAAEDDDANTVRLSPPPLGTQV